LAELEESKSRPLARVLSGLGIRHVGARVAQVLAESFPGMRELTSASEDDLAAIEEIGPVIAASIRAFLRSPRNVEALRKLDSAGVNMRGEPGRRTTKTALTGLTVVLSGTLARRTRDEAAAAIVEAGGRVSSSVSSKTDLVVVGKNPGSKHGKALELGVKTIDEAELERLLGTKERD